MRYGRLNTKGITKQKKVIHVEDMKAKLISVSQLYDDDFDVHFDK